MSDNWGDGWFLSVPRLTVRFILTMKVERLGKELGAGVWVFRIYWLKDGVFKSLSWFSLGNAPWKTRRAEEGRRSGMTMRRPEKNTKKILWQPLGNKMLPSFFFFRRKLLEGTSTSSYVVKHFLDGCNVRRKNGPLAKSCGVHLESQSCSLQTLKDGPFFFLNPSKSQKKSLTFFFWISRGGVLQWFSSFLEWDGANGRERFVAGGSAKIPSKMGSDERS